MSNKKRKFTTLYEVSFLVTVYANSAEEAQDKIADWGGGKTSDEPDDAGYCDHELGAFELLSTDDIECSISDECVHNPEPCNNRAGLKRFAEESALWQMRHK